MTSDAKTKDAWAVLVNTDLTEGRGRQVIKAICEKEVTAVRLAKGADVQGANGTVMKVTLQRQGHAWFGPVNIVEATRDDEKAQILMDAQTEAFARARSLGMTDEELQAIRRI